MPQFKSYHQSQIAFLPINIKDCLPKDHICFVINDIVNNLNLKQIEKTYSDQGCHAYDPQMLIKIMFFSYTQGIRSSRKIENQTYENVAHRFLAANQNPDHGTINLFRKKHLMAIEDIFAELVILCDRLGMINPKDISIDGSIFKASASRKNTINKEDIKRLKEKIGEFLKKADDIDAEEDKKYGKDKRGNEIPEKLIDPKTRNEEIKKMLEKMKKLKSAEKIIREKQKKAKNNNDKETTNNQTTNLIDKDASLMKMKSGRSYKPAYNGQISTSNQFILGYDVSNYASDINLLLPMIEKTENNTKVKVKIAKADAGYFSKENIREIYKKSIDVYIPDPKKSKEEKQSKENQIPESDRRNFKYNVDKDEFVCSQNRVLSFIGTTKNSRRYKCRDCSSCEVIHKCTKAKNRQITIDPELEKYKTEMRTKLNTKFGKAKYLERMSDAEPVFANILHNQNARHFLCRGKPMVKIEFGLSCIAHNLVKISNWLKNNKQSIQNIQNIQNIQTKLQAIG